ncbi:MAG: DUF1840 domain-containing protein, partial [Saezia sp.]
MSYTFKSSATTNLTMLSESAEKILSLIGKSPTPTGIIILEHIDHAILKLEQAMALEKNKKDAGGKTSTSDQEENEEDTWHDSDITLEQRAWPFL